MPVPDLVPILEPRRSNGPKGAGYATVTKVEPSLTTKVGRTRCNAVTRHAAPVAVHHPKEVSIAFTMPSDADSADRPSGSPSEDSAHTYFHNGDPVALAEAANLGDGGPEEVVQVQGFYRQVFELVDDAAWAEDPVGPLGNHWRGVGNGQSTNYLINIADMLQRLAGNVSPGSVGQSFSASRACCARLMTTGTRRRLRNSRLAVSLRYV